MVAGAFVYYTAHIVPLARGTALFCADGCVVFSQIAMNVSMQIEFSIAINGFTWENRAGS
jgi:hypothetical protein